MEIALAAGVAIAFASPSASADVELDEPIVDAGAALEEAGAIAEVDEGNNILEEDELNIEEVVLPLLLFSTDTRPIMS